MFRAWMGRTLAATLVAMASWLTSGSASAQTNSGPSCGPSCGPSFLPGGYCCPSHCCIPHYKHCAEGPPKICIKYACPKPICGPCNMPHWGYYQPCWSSWPFPEDWAHCRNPNMLAAAGGPGGPGLTNPNMPGSPMMQPGAPSAPRFNPPAPGAPQGPAQPRVILPPMVPNN